MFEANASGISTHYYKLAHLNSVNYSIYSSNNGNDQSLLELELLIRYTHPKILIAYYNKCLYYFTFGHSPDELSHNIAEFAREANESSPNIFDPAKEYPSLQLKHQSSALVEHLASPPKMNQNQNQNHNQNSNSTSTPPDEYLPLASLSFLKAVKKMALYNLSLQGVVQLFGNYSIIYNSEHEYSLLYLDSILLPSGDLLLSIVSKYQLTLFESSVLSIEDEDDPQVIPHGPTDLNFVIYLIPSGIRCHLFDTIDLKRNFVKKATENENLLKLIKLSTGTDHFTDCKEIVWIKLIPNLKHLNNQTSPISKFIHSVDNKKYILWPWNLCLLQFGRYESIEEDQPQTYSESDPLSLISEFLDFNVAHNQSSHQANNSHSQHNNNQPFSIFSAVSSGNAAGGPASTGPTNADISHPKDMGSVEIHDLTTPPGATDLFSLQNDFFGKDESAFNEPFSNNKQPQEATPAKEFEIKDDMEMDDLFGDEGSDIETGTNEVTSAQPEPSSVNFENAQPEFKNDPIDIDEKLDDLFADPDENTAPQAVEEKDINEQEMTEVAETEKMGSAEPSQSKDGTSSSDERKSFSAATFKPTFIDIPKDQMMFKKFNTPDYNDPGAPLPIVPTPIIPQSNFGSLAYNGPGSANSTFSSSQNANAAYSEDERPKQKSIFSPIIFNPIIKSNIDTKYGKGGKFYVDKEASLGPEIEIKKKNIRATSVSGYERPFKKEFLEDEDKRHSNPFNTTVLTFEDSTASESSEESDADEEMVDKIPNSPPLKLNTADDYYQGVPGIIGDGNIANGSGPGITGSAGGLVLQGSGSGLETNTTIGNLLGDRQFSSNHATGAFGSPSSNSIIRIPPLKADSPYFSGDLQSTMSPIDHSPQHQHQQQQQNQTHANVNTPTNQQNTPTTPQSSQWTGGNNGSRNDDVKIGEASNYLPLILRNINVSTIPNNFLLNNLISDGLLPSFNINDEDDNDLELSKNNEMIIKLNNLDEFLEYLGPNLIFDLGLNTRKSPMNYYATGRSKVIQSSSNSPDHFIDYKLPSENFCKEFLRIFPNSYNVKLVEFLKEIKPSENDNELDSQLNFLDDITNDEDILNPKSLPTKLKALEWDSIHDSDQNSESSRKYKSIIEQIHETRANDENDPTSSGSVVPVSSGSDNDDIYFKLPILKIRVLKNQNIVNLNSVSLNFWKYLNFSPLKSIKNFQVLLISEDNGRNSSFNSDFLDLLTTNYNECNLGTISRINLSTIDTRNDLESIRDGQILINTQNEQSYNEIYNQINKKLNSLVELIKLDLINKTNNFEFDQPLCLLFVNFNPKFNSILQISKIFRNFKTFLTNHQLPLVKIFTKIIPGDFIVKESPNQKNQLRIISNFKLGKLSLNLYNQCSGNGSSSGGSTSNGSGNSVGAKDSGRGTGIGGVTGSATGGNISETGCTGLYTQLVKEPPTKIQFKFMNTNFKDNNFNDDIFLHLAYERSIDKNWFSAAWSDPWGGATHTKSWYCFGGTQASKSNNKNVYDLGSISDDIWTISSEIFKKLSDDINKSSGGGGNSGGRKFLVLTRINSIIPDDELIHWKRLSIKHKDISLIVLSVNDSAKLLFSDDIPNSVKSQGSSSSQSAYGWGSIGGESNGVNGHHVSTGSFSGTGSGQPPMSSLDKDSANSGFNSSPFITSPSIGINFHSPQQFLNAPSNFLSPQEFGSTNGGHSATSGVLASEGGVHPDSLIHDLDSDIMGIIPKVPLPSFNSPTRLGMKIGYLSKKLSHGIEENGGAVGVKDGSYLIFEINLLSCSNYWDLEVLMRLILNHYKKLIVLNDILGLRDFDGNIQMHDLDEELRKKEQSKKLNYEVGGLIPWHIAAVSKSLNYLNHIMVEE